MPVILLTCCRRPVNLSLVLSCPVLSVDRVLLSSVPLLVSRRLFLPSRCLFLLSRRPLSVSRVVRVLSRVDRALRAVVPVLSLVDPAPSRVLFVVILRLPVARRVPRRLKADRVGVTALPNACRKLVPRRVRSLCRARSLARPVVSRRCSLSTDGILGRATLRCVSSRPTVRYAGEPKLTPGLSRVSRPLVRRTTDSTRLTRVMFRLTRATFRLTPA